MDVVKENMERVGARKWGSPQLKEEEALYAFNLKNNK